MATRTDRPDHWWRLKYCRLSPTDLTEVIDVVGSLAPKYQTDVKSQMKGLVREVYVTEWVPVRKGAVLAKLDAREEDVVLQKAEADTAAAQANLLAAETAGTTGGTRISAGAQFEGSGAHDPAESR